MQYNQDKMIPKFRLEYDLDHIYIKFMGQQYRVNRMDGKITWSDDHFAHVTDAGYIEAMAIYDVLCYSKDNCSLLGEFLNMKSLTSVQGGTLSVGMSRFQGAERLFEHKCKLLARACQKLGGTPHGKGDVAYKISVFEFLPFGIQFWDSDEDFPASLEIFGDKNILNYMHYETAWFVANYLIARLNEEMIY